MSDRPDTNTPTVTGGNITQTSSRLTDPGAEPGGGGAEFTEVQRSQLSRAQTRSLECTRSYLATTVSKMTDDERRQRLWSTWHRHKREDQSNDWPSNFDWWMVKQRLLKGVRGELGIGQSAADSVLRTVLLDLIQVVKKGHGWIEGTIEREQLRHEPYEPRTLKDQLLDQILTAPVVPVDDTEQQGGTERGSVHGSGEEVYIDGVEDFLEQACQIQTPRQIWQSVSDAQQQRARKERGESVRATASITSRSEAAACSGERGQAQDRFEITHDGSFGQDTIESEDMAAMSATTSSMKLTTESDSAGT